MPDRPTFSIVVAAHDAERTLPATIRSVLAQTRDDFELFVVDDGSTDGTPHVLAAVEDERVVALRQENLGPAAARNAGIELASGEYVSILDSDDLWLPKYLETMAHALESDPGAGLAYTDAWRLDDSTRRIHRRTIMFQQRPPRRPPSDPEALLVELLERNFVYTSATVRRTLLREVGGFQTLTRSEDYELWLRIAASGRRFVNSGCVLAVYRDRPGSRIHDRMAMLEGQLEIYQHVLQTYALTGPAREVAARRAGEIARQLDARRAASVDVDDGEDRRRPPVPVRRVARDVRLYRRRPPRAVAAAFPDLRLV